MKPNVQPGLIVLGSWHVHLVACFPETHIRPAVGRYKQAASRALGPPPPPRPRWWVEGRHMRSLPDAAAVKSALAYLWGHVDQGDLFHSWLRT
ncbi:MAG: hypothetical protein BIFFINMI_01516 [Phycisphaerae bacterium]|nr:hypothetical protein [Phycisphaerae bacterium]